MSAKNDQRRGWQGGKWCRPATRLAIYLRDGLACAWCGATVEDGVVLTLDHLVPDLNGGTNAPTNLVTACRRCNSARGTRSIPRFAAAVAEYLDHGVEAAAIVAHVRRCARRVLPRAEARELISRRGSVAAALKGASL